MQAKAEMKPLLVLGIMSGTSMDGVDYTLCEVGNAVIRLRQYWQVKYPAALRRRLRLAAGNRVSSHELAQLHHDLGRFFAGCAQHRRDQPGFRLAAAQHRTGGLRASGLPPLAA